MPELWEDFFWVACSCLLVLRMLVDCRCVVVVVVCDNVLTSLMTTPNDEMSHQVSELSSDSTEFASSDEAL